MPDAFDPSPDAPLPTEGEFRTSYSNQEWWKHLGRHSGIYAGMFPVVTAIVGFKEGWNHNLLIWFAVTILIGLTVWGLALTYRATRCRNEVINIDWHNRVVQFKGMRSTKTNLLARGPLGVTLGFDEIIRAVKQPGYRTSPSRVYVAAKETKIILGLHFDDIDGLITRLNRIGARNHKPSAGERARQIGCSPVFVVVMLLVVVGFFLLLPWILRLAIP